MQPWLHERVWYILYLSSILQERQISWQNASLFWWKYNAYNSPPFIFFKKKNKTIIATKGFLFSGESFTSRFSLVFVQGEKTGSGRRNPKESKQEPGVQEGVTGSQTLLYLQSAMGRPPQLLWILMCGADGWYRLPLFLPRSLASLQVVNLFGEQSWEPVGTS